MPLKKTYFLNRFISYTQQLKFTESGYDDREKIITSMQSFKATLVYLFMYRLQINIWFVEKYKLLFISTIFCEYLVKYDSYLTLNLH